MSFSQKKNKVNNIKTINTFTNENDDVANDNSVSGYNSVAANVILIHLTETDKESKWIHYTSGNNQGVFFNVLSKNPDGDNNVLGGTIKIECINGQDETREYAICDLIKNTSDLATIFYFTSAHVGKCGIECNMPKNCCFRLKLEPTTGDDIYLEVVLNY